MPFWEVNRSDGTMAPSWRDLDLLPRMAIALTVGQSAWEIGQPLPTFTTLNKLTQLLNLLGRTQHVRRMRFNIVSLIQSVLQFRFTRAIPHSRFNGR